MTVATFRRGFEISGIRLPSIASVHGFEKERTCEACFAKHNVRAPNAVFPDLITQTRPECIVKPDNARRKACNRNF